MTAAALLVTFPPIFRLPPPSQIRWEVIFRVGQRQPGLHFVASFIWVESPIRILSVCVPSLFNYKALKLSVNFRFMDSDQNFHSLKNIYTTKKNIYTMYLQDRAETRWQPVLDTMRWCVVNIAGSEVWIIRTIAARWPATSPAPPGSKIVPGHLSIISLSSQNMKCHQNAACAHLG